MKSTREDIGGLGNLLFKQAYLYGQFFDQKIPDVYVQSSAYWKDYKITIQRLLGTNIGFTNKIALHIRRGDYLKATNFHTDLWETDYYKNAVKHFPNQEFLVFCRDRQGEDEDRFDQEWCIEHLKELNIKWEFAPFFTTETEDLNLMASCKGLIGANSSFSWWAAFLNPFKDKVIVCPKAETWFTDGQIRCVPEEEWLQI